MPLPVRHTRDRDAIQCKSVSFSLCVEHTSQMHRSIPILHVDGLAAPARLCYFRLSEINKDELEYLHTCNN